jgi:hypothetical protein
MRHLIPFASFSVVLLAFGALAPVASAQSQDRRAVARGLAQEGAQLYEKGDFQGALEKFKQAHEQFPSPKLFFNLGRALRGLSRDLEALEAFERFLAEAKDASPEYQEHAAAQIAELGAKVARVTVGCNRHGAVVMIDGERRGTIPLEKPALIQPGAHQLTLVWEGETKSVEFTAAAGQVQSLVLTFDGKKPPPDPVVTAPKSESQVLPQAPTQPARMQLAMLPPAPVVMTSGGRGLRISGIVCGLLGVSSVGTGVYFYFRARSLSDSVASAGTFSPSDNNSGKQAETMQWVFYSVGGAALTVGTVLYLLGRPSSAANNHAKLEASPLLLRGGGGVSARGAF